MNIFLQKPGYSIDDAIAHGTSGHIACQHVLWDVHMFQATDIIFAKYGNAHWPLLLFNLLITSAISGESSTLKLNGQYWYKIVRVGLPACQRLILWRGALGTKPHAPPLWVQVGKRKVDYSRNLSCVDRGSFNQSWLITLHLYQFIGYFLLLEK